MIHPPISPVMALLLFSVLANLSVNCLGHHDEERGQDTAVYEGIVIRGTRDGLVRGCPHITSAAVTSLRVSQNVDERYT